MKTTKAYSVLVETDKWCGNVDTFICAAFLGHSDDRYGSVSGAAVFESTLGADALLFEGIGTQRETEYGMMPYQISDDLGAGYTAVEIYIDDAVEEGRVGALITRWRDAYLGKVLEAAEQHQESCTVTGIHLKVAATTVEIMRSET